MLNILQQSAITLNKTIWFIAVIVQSIVRLYEEKYKFYFHRSLWYVIWFATCDYLHICNNSWFSITRICLKFSQKRKVKKLSLHFVYISSTFRLMTGKDLHLRDCQCQLKAKYYDNLNCALWEHNITAIYLQRIQYCTRAWQWCGMQCLSVKYHSVVKYYSSTADEMFLHRVSLVPYRH